MNFSGLYRLRVLYRVLIATIGGYFFSVLVAILLSYILPTETKHAIAWSTMLFFIIYTGVIMWVFSVPTWQKAFWGVSVTSLFFTSILVAIKYLGVL
ncbi:MAG: hypothetical protein QF552_00175 [Litorilituus sp.]|jgi:ABC-type multidrug transport system permease subunit|nr:hypothetical protein [Litorilituus sp.]